MIKEFMEYVKNKKIIIFGTGELSKKITCELNSLEISYYIDNNIAKQGQNFMGHPIFNPNELNKEEKDTIFIIVASMYHEEIFEQLESMGFIARKHFENYDYFKYIGDKFYCHFCNGNYNKFLPMGVKNDIFLKNNIIGGGYRETAVCPRCHSIDRERLIYLYLKNKTNIYNSKLKVLHIAPEENLSNILNKNKNLEYICGDLYPKVNKGIIKLDVTNLEFDNNYFDAILCNHVLEHVIDDAKAMQELYRVLKPNGWAILQVPISKTLNVTYEDPNIVTVEERTDKYGQGDHVRIYGQDYVKRLENTGFSVNIYNLKSDYKDEQIKKYGLIEEEVIFVCSKLK